jgi:GNAT superfamily N-acetyltransferase
MIRIETYEGKTSEAYLHDLAQLRIAVFREYPYLYLGSLEYEKQYLAEYLQGETLALVVAWAEGQIVGVSTCTALADAAQEVRAAFEQAELPLSAYCYFGESVLLPAYRKKGIGRAFFQHREAFAAKEGFSHTTFCAVERPSNHPLRPDSYWALDPFWQALGYQKLPHLQTQMSWQDADKDHQDLKTLTFWQKRLPNAAK